MFGYKIIPFQNVTRFMDKKSIRRYEHRVLTNFQEGISNFHIVQSVGSSKSIMLPLRSKLKELQMMQYHLYATSACAPQIFEKAVIFIHMKKICSYEYSVLTIL